MTRTWSIVLLAVVAVSGGVVAGTDANADTEPPIADAGLDQDVTRNATVLLDASGSVAPDGEIEDYRWNVTDPLGDSVRVNCRDTCRFADFQAELVGRYEVTLTVTDDAGRTDSDTMYVSSDTDVPFDVSVSMPDSVEFDEPITLTASITAGDANPQSVRWERNGTTVRNESLNGVDATDRINITTEQVPAEVEVVVEDANGEAVGDELTVTVSEVFSRVQSSSNGNAIRPSIQGPQVVTGDLPLEAEYSVSGDLYGSRFIWQNETGETLGSAEEIQIRWEPGTHELYAYIPHWVEKSDGSVRPVKTDIKPVGFHFHLVEEPEHTVIADPIPQIESLAVESSPGEIQIDGEIEELYSELTRIEVRVDDETVLEATQESGDLSTDQQTYDVDVSESVDSGERTVTVLAEDRRGQVAEQTESVTVNGSSSGVASLSDGAEAAGSDGPLRQTSNDPPAALEVFLDLIGGGSGDTISGMVGSAGSGTDDEDEERYPTTGR